jgi:OOP family OmpA-OmpF porin
MKEGMEMVTLRRTATLMVLAVLMLGLSAAGWAKQKQVPKVDNFLVLYDASGSMRMEYMGSGERKAELAKEALMAMNEAIPQLGYEAGLYTVAPGFQAYQDMERYTTMAYGDAIEELPVPSGVYGIHTPLASGMERLDEVLSGLEGSTAVILVSDGGENRGGSPVDVARDLYAKHDVCFHVVSYAQSDAEKEIVNGIASLEGCSEMISGEDIQAEAALESFVHAVFYKMVAMEMDDDGDGVINSRDECPGTPAGVEVDRVGCPVDSDKDGVADYKDRCPGTARNLVVDTRGCPVEARMRLHVEFAFNKAEIRSKYYNDLENVADFLKEHPKAEMIIEGHTDSVGSEAYNMELSKKRAMSVKNYLVNKYNIDPGRLMTKGYGENRPVADNDTKAGRQENRRVVGEISEVYKTK